MWKLLNMFEWFVLERNMIFNGIRSVVVVKLFKSPWRKLNVVRHSMGNGLSHKNNKSTFWEWKKKLSKNMNWGTIFFQMYICIVHLSPLIRKTCTFYNLQLQYLHNLHSSFSRDVIRSRNLNCQVVMSFNGFSRKTCGSRLGRLKWQQGMLHILVWRFI